MNSRQLSAISYQHGQTELNADCLKLKAILKS